MVAATIFDYDYKAFLDIEDILLFRVATFLPNLVKIGQKMRE